MTMTENELVILLGIGHVVAVMVIPPIVWVLSVMVQNRQGKREAQMKVFLTLMADRRSDPMTKRWVDALNVIDVVFQDSKKIRRAWQEYMVSLSDFSEKNSEIRQIVLLSEMAKYLGYRNLKKAEIHRFYRPKYFSEQKEKQEALIEENLRVLKRSGAERDNLPAGKNKVAVKGAKQPQRS